MVTRTFCDGCSATLSGSYGRAHVETQVGTHAKQVVQYDLCRVCFELFNRSTLPQNWLAMLERA